MSRFTEQEINNNIIKINKNPLISGYSPLVSIIITSFNRPKYLEELCNSIFNQSFKNFEVIIWDDGSNQKTVDIIKNWNKKDSRFKYVIFERKNTEIPNRGRNLGILLSKGKYICFIDDDDKYKFNFLEVMLRSLSGSDSGMSYCVYDVIDQDSRPMHRLWQFAKRRNYTLTYKDLYKSNSIGLPEGFINKEVLIRSGIFDERIPALMDWDLWLRIFNIYKISSTWNTLGSVRINHGGRITGNSRRYHKTPGIGNAYEFIHSKRLEKKLNIALVGKTEQINILTQIFKKYTWITTKNYPTLDSFPSTFGIVLVFIDPTQNNFNISRGKHINVIPVFYHHSLFKTNQQTLLLDPEREQKFVNKGCSLFLDSLNYNKLEWFLALLQGFSTLDINKLWPNQ